MLTTICLGAAGADRAFAGFESYCVRTVGANDVCKGDRHSLTGNYVRTNGQTFPSPLRKCAGAFLGSDINTFYGSYFCATNTYACHVYSGDRLLYPAAREGSGISQPLYGQQSFGADQLSGCPSGS